MSHTWMALAGVIAALVVLLVLRRLLRNFLADKAEQMRLAERARVADQETMSQYRADIDRLQAVPEQENVQQRIREALDERKSRDQWQRAGGGTPGAAK